MNNAKTTARAIMHGISGKANQPMKWKGITSISSACFYLGCLLLSRVLVSISRVLASMSSACFYVQRLLL